ncbi:protein MIX23 isoform X1 [Anastrepha ludens]|uniref:protein MIX23 isoform X1 n=1 Tax=Anastrepha ludens TaxID=28586 RepID=UPI0023AE98DF|nr:protein MIX23 isoform X1 [Anastrepha ludens]
MHDLRIDAVVFGLLFYIKNIKFKCLQAVNESIQKMRALDDNIIHALNSAIPTESFKGQVNCDRVCNSLYTQLQDVHKHRKKKIEDCIFASAESLKKLRELRENNREDVSIDKKFKLEQRKLRLLQSEINVEDIVNERSLKAFKERCRPYLHSGAL